MSLSDLAVVTVIRYEGNVFEKNREFSFLFCDHADPEQREALKTIFMGKAGGAFAAWRDLTIRVDGVDFVPMDVSFTDEEWKVEVPGMVEALGGPYRKHMVPENETLSHIQRFSSRHDTRSHHRGSSIAQCREGRFWSCLGLVRSFLQAHRI